MPTFGIMEHYTMYNDSNNRNPDLTYHPDGAGGYYTHYVDNANIVCSNINNVFGTISNPRCDIPTIIVAGSVVQVKSGSYAISKNNKYFFNGTLQYPIFVQGVNNPTLQPGAGYWGISGDYFIVENFTIDRLNFITRAKDNPRSSTYSALRNSEVKNGGGNAVRLYGNNMVSYNNHVHHNNAGGSEAHGVYIGQGSKQVWILDNEIHHNSGDSIQFTHGASTGYPEYVYIGRNTMYSDRENAVDLKFPHHVIISQNKMHSYRNAPNNTLWCDDKSHCGTYSSGSDGAAMVIGSDGAPNDVWILFNEISDSNVGIRVENATNVNIIGNVITDVSGAAIKFDKRASPTYILNNTIHNSGKGIEDGWQEGITPIIINNIFSNLSNLYLDIDSNKVVDKSTLDTNIFSAASSSFPIVWNYPITITSTGQLNSLAGTAVKGNIIADIDFVNSQTGNYSLTDPSYAIASGSEHAQYDVFTQLFGTSIKFDFHGNPRPQGAAWNI